MALFKLRKKVDEPMAATPAAESIEAIRRRARHRLIGAVVLVLVGVVGFPLLFDTQPRPVSVDIPIEIPDRNKARPLPPVAQAPLAQGKVTAPETQAPAPATPDKTPEAKADARAEPKPDEGAKARALLEAKSVDTAAAGTRYVVQVGAFAERDKARLAQQKLERAGFKNYTNVAETKDGTRIRVRAGPFASRAEADKAAEKIKGLDLPAAVLSL
ncbi:SPOR domain-containing protein [Ramlibacter sp. PS3R-8]|uniref:SPOR domain-containing protein n=1 Tax=Ramlibacter sp. PS3R-8 TaxID=3133437 RepID=UPI0030A391C4